MAKVKGPLFSITTWGTFGNILTFQRRPGMPTVYVKPHPKIPNTAAQLAQKASLTSAVSSWQALSGASKAWWVEKARGTRVSGYNMYIQNYLLGLL